MSRTTQVTCDNEGCGFEDGIDGGTTWITVRRKKEINADLCSNACLNQWVKDREAAGDADDIEAQLTFSEA